MRFEETRRDAICPKCKKQLYSVRRGESGGEIGFCKACGYWRGLTPQARKDALLHQRREDERTVRRLRLSFAGGALSIVLLFAMTLYITVFLPQNRYNSAVEMMAAGGYEEAKAAFEQMADYRDAALQADACGALIEMNSGSVVSAERVLAGMGNAGGKETGHFADSVIGMLQDWQKYGISDADALRMLGYSAVLEPDGGDRLAEIRIRVQKAMTGIQADICETRDADGDQRDELVLLTERGDLHVFRMNDNGPEQIELSPGNQSALMLHFAENARSEGSEDRAAAYALAAVRMMKSEESLEMLTAVMQEAAAKKAEDNDLSGAAQALSLLSSETGKQEHFQAYFEMQHQYAASLAEEAAFTVWNEFSLEQGEKLAAFGLEEAAGTALGRFRLNYAKMLASHGDETCIDELRIAASEGADVLGEMQGIIAQYPDGVIKTVLRLLEAELTENGEQAAQLRDEAGREVEKVLSDWKESGMEGIDALRMILLCEQEQLNMGAVDVTAVWTEALTEAAKAWNFRHCVFVKWNGDTHESLMGITESGAVCALNMAGNNLSVRMQEETGLGNARLEVLRDEQHMIMATDDVSAFAVYTVDGEWTANEVVREAGVNDLSYDGQKLAYGRELAGSIERSSRWEWGIDTAAQPVRTGIDWGKDRYVFPADGMALITRWLEAHAYGIEEEKQILTSAAVDASIGRSAEVLTALPVPDDPAQAVIELYQVVGNTARWRMQYQAQGETVNTFVSCIRETESGVEHWRMAGAGYGFGAQEMEPGQEDIEILPLGQKLQASLADKNDVHTYRLLVPAASSVQMQWQAGEKDQTEDMFDIRLYSQENTSQPHLAWRMAPQKSTQVSQIFYLKPGVYYVQVSPIRFKQMQYSLTFAAQDESYVELENNDSASTANMVELNAVYHGSLQTMKNSSLNMTDDIDVYQFRLDENSLVRVLLGAENAGKRETARLILSVHDGENGEQMTGAELSASQDQTETPAAYLSAGSYYVQIRRGSNQYTGRYSLEVVSQPAAGCEAEPNDTADQANPIGLNAAINASSIREQDIDRYSFTLDQDSLIQPMMNFVPLRSSTKAYTIRIFSGEQEVFSVNIGGKESEKVVRSIVLPKGDYQVQVTNVANASAGSVQPYTLRINQSAVGTAEQEPNDYESSAHRIEPGQTVTGYASDAEDIDWYVLSVEQEKLLTLNVELLGAGAEVRVFTIRGEQNGKRFLEDSVGAKGYSVQMRVQPGTYYFYMKPQAATAAIYNLSFVEN